jgi:hypothetical protein
MQIEVAHGRDQGIDFFVFNADATSRVNTDRDTLLRKLTQQANRSGLSGQKAALAYREGGRLSFYGTPDLVRYLSARPGTIRWTHTISV